MRKRLCLACALAIVTSSLGASLRDASRAAASEDGSGSGASGLDPPPLYPLPPSPADGPPSPNPFANIDFDTEPVGGSVIVPPPPVKAGGEGGEEGSGSSDSEAGGGRLGGDGLPFEPPPLESPPDKPVNLNPYHLRKDSFNPYCDVCKLVAQTMALDGGGDGGCKFAPEARKKDCENLEKMFKKNLDAQMLLMGCIDKTGPAPIRCAHDVHLKNMIFEERKLYPDNCPAIIMCNIIEDESGGPICGKVLRSWGDFLGEDIPNRASGRPTPWDAYPKALEAPRFAPPPWLGVYPGNPYCDLCVDIMNSLQANSSATPEYACLRQPESLRWKCEEVAAKMKSNPQVQGVLSNGCVDRTGESPVDKGGGQCPGFVACNLLDSPSGPMCGDMVGQLGDPKGGS